MSSMLSILKEADEKQAGIEQAADDVIAVEGEVERLNARPDDVPSDVWDLMLENGELATTRLHEILLSPRFPRLRASDQAKLIALAQNRAYGTPKQNRVDPKRGGQLIDVTAHELGKLVERAALPEYKKSDKADYNIQQEVDEL